MPIYYEDKNMPNNGGFENTSLITPIKDIKDRIYNKLFNEGIQFYEINTIIVKKAHIIAKQRLFVNFALTNIYNLIGKNMNNNVYQYESVNEEDIKTLRNIKFQDNGIVIELFNNDKYYPSIIGKNISEEFCWEDIVSCEEKTHNELNINLTNGSSLKVQPIFNFLKDYNHHTYSNIQGVFCEIMNEHINGIN